MTKPGTNPPRSTPDRRPPSRLTRWRQLPAPERLLALQLSLLLPIVDLSLRVVGFQRTWGWLARFARRNCPGLAPEEADIAAAGRLAELARAVGARSPWPASCLRQALTVWLLLRRRRLPAELKIGVQRRNAPFQAHAWVELGGVALDPTAAAHQPFPDLPSTP
jgi:hypothetical protein